MDLQRTREAQRRSPPAPPSPPPQPGAAAAPDDPSRIWLPELVGRFAGSLAPNEVACALRLVNKTAAAQFRGQQHATVHLSQPVPPSEFALRWAGPDALRCLTRRQREDLALLTARSGSITNLQVLLARDDMAPSRAIFTAAAGAGRLDVCVWLHQRGYPWDCSSACMMAAKQGHQAMCEWLLATQSDHPSREGLRAAMACYAVRGGHVSLMDWLLLTNERPDMPDLLSNAAAGCDLPTLQRLHHTYLDSRGEELPQGDAGDAVDAAAGSRTADWPAKVEWLQARGYSLTERACFWAVATPDADSRLQWLQLHGFPPGEGTVELAAEAGNAEAVRYLLGQLGVEAARHEAEDAQRAAAQGGHVAVMEVLHTHGVTSTEDLIGSVTEAAQRGHLPAVAWLVQALGAATALNASLFEAAAWSGCTELLTWLHEQGCPWDMGTFGAAVAEGSQQQLEWLVERGCPMGDNGMPYVQAATNGDLAMLRCLRRLGCPWSADGSTVACIVRSLLYWESGTAEKVLPGLLWLLDEGFPVDWASAESAAGKLSEECSRGRLVAWLQEQRQQRQQQTWIRGLQRCAIS